MTFKWQGRAYNTSEMKVFETDNPAMPVVYVGPNGEVFVVEIDRLEGVEVRLAERSEAALLAERHGFSDLLGSGKKQAGGPAVARHALIVEDDGLSRHALATLLNRSGYKTAYAATVAEAVIKLEERPNWLILDLRLPDGRGTTLLERIRSENLPIKVAITTGETDQALLSQVSGLEPDIIFHKPLDLSQIMHWLDAA
jgi:CheY-like chemotaxis protein